VSRNRREVFLNALFNPETEFIGKDINYVVSKAGPHTWYGSMDYGQDVAQWSVGHLFVEVWFQSGLCTEVVFHFGS
jgi:hypothetical protein